MSISGPTWVFLFKSQGAILFPSNFSATKCCLLTSTIRVLTKLMCAPLKHWQVQGIYVFIHLDDGLTFAGSRKQALQVYAFVPTDQKLLGFLISEEKCSWGACLVLDWTGFTWNTSLICLFITDRKIQKAEDLVANLSEAQGLVQIRRVAHLVGLLVSFYLAMGLVSRFHSRWLTTFVASWAGQTT